MAVLDILTVPNPVLKQVSTPVEQVDDDLRRLMDDMLETMYAAPGIGLAAPQIGVPLRVLVLDCSKEGEPRAPMAFANPEIVWASEERIPYEEGCLSLPEQFADVTRPRQVRVRYLDRQNEIRELAADGLLAVCLQHEMDHLEGTLFVDHLSTLRRGMIIKKLQKYRKAKAEQAEKQPA
jgi:peptide deformylase